jgi:hypothetical protein
LGGSYVTSRYYASRIKPSAEPQIKLSGTVEDRREGDAGGALRSIEAGRGAALKGAFEFRLLHIVSVGFCSYGLCQVQHERDDGGPVV